MPDEARTEIIRRLRAVCENLGCLHALVDAGAPYGQVLCQFSTIQAELQTLKIRILNYQINASKRILQFDPSADNRLTELHRLLDLYNILIQST